jgi:REP element-mobilizing transposase RayT
MARPPRMLEPNGIYHVTTRGVRQAPLFRDDFDRRRYMELLAKVVRRYDWSCRMYCLMTNHVHLLLQSPGLDLPDAMRDLNRLYAVSYNRRYGFTGHAFERRYWSELISDEAYLMESTRYVALNPVRAGLCSTPAGWRWSAYRGILEPALAPRLLDVEATVGVFGSTRALRDYVERPD